MSEEMKLLESKVRLLGERVGELRAEQDSLALRMSNLERAQERLAEYGGIPVDRSEVASEDGEVRDPLDWDVTRTDESD